ncbi:TPA: type III secretion system translocon subunit SctE [Stenotrophomonas maltophilia]
MIVKTPPNGTTPTAFTVGSQSRIAAVASGFGVVNPQQLQAVTEKVLALAADNAAAQQPASGNGPGVDAPSLRRPALRELQQAARHEGAGRLTPEAALGYFMSELSALLSTDNLEQLKSRMALVQARLKERAESAQLASDALQNAYAKLEAALANAETAAEELANAQRALQAAKAEVERLQKELANAGPGEQEALRAQLKAAQAHLQQVTACVDLAQQAVSAALLQISIAETEVAAAEQGVDEIAAIPLSLPRSERGLTNDARLSELLAVLQEIVGKANDAKLARDMELARELLRVREAENLRRSKEYQEQIEKAERTKKTMGCIGKIVGWVLTVVAVIAAPFSGSASMVLAGIGLTLAVASELGVKVFDKAIQKIMDLVMKAVKAVGGVIGNALEIMGLSRKIIDKLEMALGAVAVAAMIIGALFASKKLAASIASKEVVKQVAQRTAEAVSRAASQMVNKALPAITKNVTASAGKQLAVSSSQAVATTASGALPTISNTATQAAARSEMLARRAGQAMMASHVMQFGHQTAQGVANVVIADMQVKAAKVLAELELGMADTKILRDLIQKLLEYFVAENRMVQALFQQMADVQDTENDTARYIAQRIARA